MKKLLTLVLCVVMLATLAVGCGTKTDEPATTEKTKVVIGTMIQYEAVLQAVEENFEAMGYELEIQMIDTLAALNNGLEERSMDANFFQHKPYMESFNASNGGHLVALEPGIMHSVYALYSEKYASLEELPDGALIGVPADPSNQSCNLEVLHDAGVITLQEKGEDGLYNLFDIIDNPHNYEFLECEMSAQPGLYPDVDAMLAAAVSFSKAGLDISSPLAINQNYEDYPMIVAVHEEDADAQWAKDLAKAFTAEGMADVINTSLAGTFVAIF